MSGDGVRQKLAAILAADVAGYSRLMADDERATIATLDAYRAVFQEQIESHGGRVVDMAGDSVLALFDSATGAVEAAVAVQAALAEKNADLPDARRMQFRIGVNSGDIQEKSDGTIYGDGVNVAARLESLATPGGVMISESAHMHVRTRLEVGFEDAGAHTVKNIAEPVRAYWVVQAGAPAPRQSSRTRNIIAATVPASGVLCLAVWSYLTHGDTEVADRTDAPLSESTLPPLPTGPSIAVLPFDNLSDDPNQEYFADGLAEDILSRLAAFRDLKVIARNSSFKFKGTSVDVREIGRDLGAQYVLEGSVRRDEASIRVSAQLLTARDGAHVWSETYDRDLSTGSIFAIQDEISKQVVAALGGAEGEILASEISRIQSVPTQDLRSYECVSLAKQYAVAVTPELHLKARTCLEEVVAKEPDYVEALAWLGSMYLEEMWTGFNPRESGPSSLEAAFEVLISAVQLDSHHQAARRTLSQAYYWSGDADKFHEEALKAIDANPNDVETIALMAQFIGYSGRWDESKALTKRLRELTDDVPIWHNYTEYQYHYRDKNFGGAAASARATLEIDHWSGPWALALAYTRMGENEKAVNALADARAMEPNLTDDVVRGLMEVLFLDQAHIALIMKGHAELMALEEELRPSRPVIAVLPFDNFSGDAAQDYFADGITENIIARLAKVSNIRVLGRNTTFQFRGQAIDTQSIAKNLGADYVLEGSIQRGDDTLRVTAQLLSGDDGTHLWAETYDRQLDVSNIFDIQDSITEVVVSRVGGPLGEISRHEFRDVSSYQPTRLSSYECLLLWNRMYVEFTYQNYLGLIECSVRATEEDPKYPWGWAIKAVLKEMEVAVWAEVPHAEGLKDAFPSIETAVRLAPDEGIIRVWFGRLLVLSGDLQRGGEQLEKGLMLDPNNATLLGEAADVYSMIGDYERAVHLMDKMKELNPNYSPWLNFVYAKMHAVNKDWGKVAISLLDTQMTEYFWMHAGVAAAECLDGNVEAGREAFERALEIQPNIMDILWPAAEFWNKGPDAEPWVQFHVEGIAACGYEIPPDPR